MLHIHNCTQKNTDLIFILLLLQKKHSKEVTHNFAWSRFDLSPLWNFVQDTTWCSKIFLPLFFIDGIARIVSTEFCLCLSLTPHSPPGWPLRCARLHFKHQCISVFSTKMQEDIFFFQYTNHWCVKKIRNPYLVRMTYHV